MIARNAAPSPLGSAAPENRLADLTARLRADNARLAERTQKLEAPATAPQRSSSNVERAALAAIAAAVAPDAPQPAAAAVQPASYGDVTVRPIAQKPTLF